MRGRPLRESLLASRRGSRYESEKTHNTNTHKNITHTHTHTYTHTHTHTCARAHAHAYSPGHTHIHTHTYTHAHAHSTHTQAYYLAKSLVEGGGRPLRESLLASRRGSRYESERLGGDRLRRCEAGGPDARLPLEVCVCVCVRVRVRVRVRAGLQMVLEITER